jgi:hypothetical protein
MSQIEFLQVEVRWTNRGRTERFQGFRQFAPRGAPRRPGVHHWPGSTASRSQTSKRGLRCRGLRSWCLCLLSL